MLVEFRNGIVGTIRTSWAFDLPAGHHPVHIVGERGQLYGGDNRLWFQPDGWQPAALELPQADTFAREIEHFADCLFEGRAPLASLQDGIDTLRLIRAVYDA